MEFSQYSRSTHFQTFSKVPQVIQEPLVQLMGERWRGFSSSLLCDWNISHYLLKIGSISLIKSVLFCFVVFFAQDVLLLMRSPFTLQPTTTLKQLFTVVSAIGSLIQPSVHAAPSSVQVILHGVAFQLNSKVLY